MEHVGKELAAVIGENRVKVNEPMSQYTTIKIGGPADYFVDATTTDELVKLVGIGRRFGLHVWVFGGGTNVLVSDKGIRGLVIKNNCRKIDVMGMKGMIKHNEVAMEHALVFAEAGAITNQLVRFTIDQGLSGLETALGLPGTIGGAVVMNANFPKRNIFVGENLKSAKILTSDGEIKEVDRAYFQFDFDTSAIQTSGDIILSVFFQMKPVDKSVLWERGTEAITYRGETQPKNVTGGITFRNLQASRAVKNDETGNMSAQEMIEKAGVKGLRVGGARISEVNPRYIINEGEASVADVVELGEQLKKKIYELYGAMLRLSLPVIGEV